MAAMIKGRPVDGVIWEIWDGHPHEHPFEECFPLATQVLFVDVPDDTLPGAVWDGNTWVNLPNWERDSAGVARWRFGALPEREAKADDKPPTKEA